MKYDVAVIGSGVVGALISRELSKYDIKVALLERCNDVAMLVAALIMGVLTGCISYVRNKANK